jgi:ketosteroid isomerase-like protein
MRPFPLLVAFLPVLACVPLSRTSAQKPARANQPATAVERTLYQLENDWAKGLVKRDTMIFRRLTAPRFIYTEDATLMTREQVIRGIATSGDKVESAGNEDMVVHDFGQAAIVTGILVVRSRGAKGPFTTRYRFTDTWLKTGGTWQAIGAQDYVIPERKPAK